MNSFRDRSPFAGFQPKRLPVIRSLLLPLLCLLTAPASPAAPVISEFCASNQNGLRDEDGERPDWIEIHNPDDTPANLEGWYLSDNPLLRTKWRFPATIIPAKGNLVVFASSKNRTTPGQALHTNFSLSANGEFLGLFQPDGSTPASEFAPSFPPQFPDLSYGQPSSIATQVLLNASAQARWIVPSSSTSPSFTQWRSPAFNDSTWNAATQGIGFDRNTSGVNYLPEIGTGGNTQSAMYNIRSSCFIRIPFAAPDPSTISRLTLRVKFDDGFAAYLNGSNLLSGGTHVKRNAPATLAWNSNATATNDDSAAIVFHDIDVTENIPKLTSGDNLLAIHALNQSNNSSDLLMRAELRAEVETGETTTYPVYFRTPTPGARNSGTNDAVIPQDVTFSTPAGTFSSNFYLSLGGALQGQEIRYTTDGSTPTTSSTLYTTPVTLSSTTAIRARIFDPTTGAASFTAGAHYEKLEASLTNYGSTGTAFRSALPIIVLNNRGAGEVPNNNLYQDVRIHVIDRNTSGYASISSPTTLSLPAGAKIRGSSSANFPKKSYGIELRDESASSRNHPLLGMPASDDWALISCYDFDRAFMRNAMIYEIARQSGHWSPRTRFVELWFNQDGDSLEYADYRGVYLLCENIRQGPNRADLTEIEPGDITQPDVSGGYIFKVDRYDSDEFYWQTNRGLPSNTTGNALTIHRPKLADLAIPQSTYLKDHFQQFEDTLVTEASSSFATRNYLNFIEPISWADHNLFNMFAMNVDALRLSAYFLKDRGRRMEGGPLWDFDRSANSTDSRDNTFNAWYGTGDATNYFTYAWWQYLFADPEFRQTYVDRWHTLRRGTLANANIQSILDSFLAEFRTNDSDNPSTRDYARWYGSATSNHLPTEVANMKSWLLSRAAWIDSQLGTAPTASRPPGPVTQGQTVALTVPSGTTVYYTLDGSDPRMPGGALSATAIRYTGSPIPITATTLLTARAYRSGGYSTPATNWSGPVTALYTINEPYASLSSLRVSAIHYHPLAPDQTETAAIPDLTESDFEWIELTNASSTTINLEGVSLQQGAPVSSLTLPPRSLSPGGRVLIVKRTAAITLRYPDLDPSKIIAEWTGDQNLNNGGEDLVILARDGSPIASFRYDDDNGWPSRADGVGSALEFIGPDQDTASYQNPAFWRSSRRVHGTPGDAPPTFVPSVVINEILANPPATGGTAIELVNTAATPADLSGWHLSNTTDPQSADDYRKYTFPPDTILPPGGFLTLTERDFNPNGPWNPDAGNPSEREFTPDGPRGGSLQLISSTPTGQLARFENLVDYQPTLPNTSIGRWPDGSGSLTPLAFPTLTDATSTTIPAPALAAPNSPPRIGAVQITEIQFLAANEFKYIEISNSSNSKIDLNKWTLRGSVDFYFTSNHSLDPDQRALLVPFDPVLDAAANAAFVASYPGAAQTVLWGPWNPAATLPENSGTVRLMRKVPPPADEPGFVGLMTEEEVRYQNAAPWPVIPAGTVASIHRLGTHLQPNDPTAWAAFTPSPGKPVDLLGMWLVAEFPGGGPDAEPSADPDTDGLSNAMEYALGSPPRSFSPLAPTLESPDPDAPPLFRLPYSRRLDRPDVTITAEEAADPAGPWQPATLDVATGSDATTEYRQAALPATQARGFLRLRVSQASQGGTEIAN